MTHIAEILPLIPKLRRRARRLMPSLTDAEDLVQDTLVQLCFRLRHADEIENLEAYAMQALSNRAHRLRAREATDMLEDDMATTEPTALKRLELSEVLKEVARLPAPQRELLEQIAFGESSPRLLAHRLDLPLGTVNSRLARARAKLRETRDLVG